jgi:Rieske Fe-S protein
MNDELEERGADCPGCGDASRRLLLGQMSGAVLAALVGVPLMARHAGAVPVAEAGGAQTGPAEWTYPVPAADGVAIDRDAQIILVRFQQHAYAFNLACPHENTALRWRAQEGRFQCPRHESKYGQDGVFLSGRATRNMDRLAIQRTAKGLAVDVNRLFRSDQQASDWAAASVAL